MYKVFTALAVVVSSAAALGQTCTGLCLQQKTDCAGGSTTSISGTVYAPNGTDPLSNVTVYIPNGAVGAFPAGVSCPVIGAPPSGNPLVGTTTDVKGNFTLENVPVGNNIPLVILSGRWRRQLTVPGTAACTDTRFSARMPRNQSEGDIPRIAVATGSADQVECVLRKVGIDDTEFTDPGGSGRINLYSGSGSPGARVSPATPAESTLMSNTAALNAYDVLMLPCQGREFVKTSSQLANLIQFANAGGRIYSSHFSYVWMYRNAPFDGVANWHVNQSTLPDGMATVNTGFSEGQILAEWLQAVGASSTLGQMSISTIKHDLDDVIPPTKTWLTLNDAAHGNPVMQFTFDTPVGAANQCGRVLFNEYHVEDPAGSSPAGKIFPAECPSRPMTPQEKLLEYSLFSLTGDGGEPLLEPSSADFGSQAIGFATAPKIFTWTNHSSFSASVTSATATGDFAVVSNNCRGVASGASCQIGVGFTPTALAARTGTLTVASPGKTLTASLTGTGSPGLVSSPASLDFGNVDVGGTATRSITITNNAPGAISIPAMSATGDYLATSACGASLPAGASCIVNLTLRPTAIGSRTGTWSVSSSGAAYSGLTASLTGLGIDFSISLNPASGNTIAGYMASTIATLTPSVGFAHIVTLTCTNITPASECDLSSGSVVLSSSATLKVNMSTGSKYTVTGYGGFGGRGVALVLTLVSSAVLYLCRRRAGLALSLCIALCGLGLVTLTGCSGKYPAQNTFYTPPGSYKYTVSATDGIITRTADYTLTVTAK